MNRIPKRAIPTIPREFTSSGLRSLGIAWKMITIEPPIKIEEEKSAENSESLWYQNVRFISGDLCAPLSKSQEANSATLSPKSCNASERIARLFVQRPPISSIIVKARFRKAANLTLFSRSGI